MKCTLVTIAVLGCLLLTGCGNSVDDVKRDAEFAKVCKDSGGHVWYDGLNGGIHCSFEVSK